MSVCVCIASRGRPVECRKSIEALTKAAVLPDTHCALALDEDDPAVLDYGPLVRKFGVGIAAERDISLGAKYNRAASYARPGTTVYVLGVDDCHPCTPGWDRTFIDAADKFPDGVGVIYSGDRRDELFQLPEGCAVTKRWIEQVGFFCPPYFPFWWHDTWIDELARFTGRYVWANVDWEKHGPSEAQGHKTTRMREVSWWARFFDATRQMRVDKAVEMINRLNYPPWYGAQLRSELQLKANLFWQRNALVRDHGANFEAQYGAETTADPGYDRIKAEATAMLKAL